MTGRSSPRESPLSIGEVLARANAALVDREPDVTGTVAGLLGGGIEALGADAAAVLVESDDSLELLAATSHRVADLEIYQAQAEEGPCVDALRAVDDIDVVGADAIERRWPHAGPVIVRSGYACVHATPLTWHGETFGGLNLFRTDPVSFETQQAECRALADAVTLAIVSRCLGADHVTDGLRAALEERAVVEQAKGAIAVVRSVDMASAYDALLAFVESEGTSLGLIARRVMREAREGTLTDMVRGT